jgi:hypothetical protein
MHCGRGCCTADAITFTCIACPAPPVSLLQYNYLNQLLPHPDELKMRLLRSAFIGFCAGVASDVTSNSVRVVKTTRQTARRAMSYREVVQVRSWGAKRAVQYVEGCKRGAIGGVA